MSKLTKGFKLSIAERRQRQFSESFKRKIVQEIEQKKTRVIEVCRAHEVSTACVYQWINQYRQSAKPLRTIVESDSDTAKAVALMKKVKELERMVGQKQIQIDFMTKMIELAEEHYKIDIKKNLKEKP